MNIQGIITNEAGTPVSGAKVDIFVGGTAIAGVNSGSSGRFEFSNETPCAGQELQFVVAKEGFKPLTQTTSPSGDSVDLTLKLEELPRPLNITGIVMDQNGRPVTGAQVGIFADDKELTTLPSGSQGEFTFSSENPPARRVVRLVVAKDGFETLTQDLRPEGQKDLRLTLKDIVPPNGLPWRWILVAVALIAGAVTIFLLLPKKLQVPNVVGKPIEEASNLLAKAELRLEVAEHLATGTNQIGIVIRQTPQAGEKVVRDAIVDLTIEKELDKVKVPDLIGLLPEQLRKVYGNLPIKMVQEKKAHTGTQQPGFIAAQTPPAGTDVAPGATVNFTVEDKKPEDPAPAYVGTWANQNVRTTRITTFTITWRDKGAYVRVWSKDSVTDWGEKQAKLSGNSQLETTWDRGFNVVKLLMTVENQRIRLDSTFSPKGAGPPQSSREFFTPRRNQFELFKSTPMAPQKIIIK